MDLGLEHGRVIVTGGASNIGRGIVHAFSREGARVAILDLDGRQSERVRIEALDLGAEDAAAIVSDLAADGAAATAVATVVERWQGVDVLVNCAGGSRGAFFTDDTDRAGWQRTVEANLFTAIATTQAVLGPMREAGRGSIVFLSSDAAAGEIRQAVYGATKAAVIALARSVAKEHGRHGIRSNIVAPGLVLPERAEAVGASSLWADGREAVFSDRQIDALLAAVPLHRLSTADDVADAVLWLSSDRVSRQLTGQLVSVSGGYAMP